MNSAPQPFRSPATPWVLLTAAVLWACAMTAATQIGSLQHDYPAYLAQWKLVLDGQNPWLTNNAYGPLHNALAIFVPLGPAIPRLIIGGGAVWVGVLLLWELITHTGRVGRYGIYALSIPLNGLVIWASIVYGNNDGLVAAFVGLAIASRHRGQPAMAGVMLGLAVLLKYYPIVLIPLFMLGPPAAGRRLAVAALATIALGLAIAVGIWGGDMLAAVGFGAARGPKMLSILETLANHPGLVPGELLQSAIRYNSIAVAVVALAGWLLCWRYRLDWLSASVLVLLAVLATYKVGHTQFYIPWLFLVAALPLVGTFEARRLQLLCVPLVVFLSLYELAYAATGGYRAPWQAFRDNVGLPFFVLAAATIAGFAWQGRRAAPRPAGRAGEAGAAGGNSSLD